MSQLRIARDSRRWDKTCFPATNSPNPSRNLSKFNMNSYKNKCSPQVKRYLEKSKSTRKTKAQSQLQLRQISMNQVNTRKLSKKWDGTWLIPPSLSRNPKQFNVRSYQHKCSLRVKRFREKSQSTKMTTAQSHLQRQQITMIQLNTNKPSKEWKKMPTVTIYSLYLVDSFPNHSDTPLQI